MKQHLSVLTLMARSSLVWILLLLLALALGNGFFFAQAVRSLPEEVKELPFIANDLSFVFGAVFFLLTLALSRVNRQTQTAYTLHRLSISKGAVFFWQAVCNMGFYLILLGWQLLLVLVLSGFYFRRLPPEAVSNQTLFLSFYRSDFLHSLLPLSNVGGIAANLSYLLALGLGTAVTPVRLRAREIPGELICLLVVYPLFFIRGSASMGESALLFLFSVILMSAALCRLGRKEIPNEED